jgi:UPF0755 protein
MFDIGTAADQLGLFKPAAFVQAARDPAMIRDIDPKAPTLEGYLFPDTYRLKLPPRRRSLQASTDHFREAWKSLHASANVHVTVTLAAMVEKEGKLAEERSADRRLRNRLRIGMKPDCDPTTVYAAPLEALPRHDPPQRPDNDHRTTPTAIPTAAGRSRIRVWRAFAP